MMFLIGQNDKGWIVISTIYHGDEGQAIADGKLSMVRYNLKKVMLVRAIAELTANVTVTVVNESGMIIGQPETLAAG